MVDFRRDLDLEFSRSNMEFYISAKNGPIAWNKKQTHRLNSRPQMWPLSLTLAMTLTLNFQGQIWNLLYLSQKWCDCHKTKSKHIYWSQDLKYDHWVTLAMALTLNFQGQIWYWLYLCQKWPDCHEMKSKHRLNFRLQMWPSDFTFGCDLDLEFSRSNMRFAISQPKVVQWPRNEKLLNISIWTLGLKCDQWVWPWPWPWYLNLQGHVILTIWWPRCKDYQIVTGVTSIGVRLI